MARVGVLVLAGLAIACSAQPSEFIITYDGLTNEELQTKCGLLNCSRVFSNVIQGIVVTKDPLAANSLSTDDPSVQDLTPNSKVTLYQDPVDPSSTSVQTATGALVTNNSILPYHLDRIDQLSLPLDGKYVPYNNCSNVTIYIIDTGVYQNHSEFLSADGTFSRVTSGYAAGALPGDGTTDCSGHGTFVASMAAGRTVGVCSEATIVPVAVLNCIGDGAISQIVEGLEWVVADAQTRGKNSSLIINMSLGLERVDDVLLSAVNNTVLRFGLPFFTPAGNAGSDACMNTPARSVLTISVGSVDQRDNLSDFSNFGRCVDGFVPGQRVKGAAIGRPDQYTVMSGTSQSAPIAAGMVMQLMQVRPQTTWFEIKDFFAAAYWRNPRTNARILLAPPLTKILTAKYNTTDLCSILLQEPNSTVEVQVSKQPGAVLPPTQAYTFPNPGQVSVTLSKVPAPAPAVA